MKNIEKLALLFVAIVSIGLPVKLHAEPASAANPKVDFERGVSEFNRGLYAEALQSLELANKLKPGDAITRYYAASCLVKLDRPDDAYVYYRQACDNSPPASEVHKLADTALKNLLKTAAATNAVAPIQSNLPSGFSFGGSRLPTLKQPHTNQLAEDIFNTFIHDPHALTKTPSNDVDTGTLVNARVKTISRENGDFRYLSKQAIALYPDLDRHIPEFITILHQYSENNIKSIMDGCIARINEMHQKGITGTTSSGRYIETPYSDSKYDEITQARDRLCDSLRREEENMEERLRKSMQ